MLRLPFVAGNWKMNLTKVAARELVEGIGRHIPSAGVQIGVAPPAVYIEYLASVLSGTPMMVGAQNCYFEKSGAFTGEVSAEMLKDVGASFAINGHSERRHLFGESSELVARKAAAIYNSGLILVHCVGETLAERDANATLSVVEAQLKELQPSLIPDPHRLVIAYEPVWAIGTGRNATDAQAQEVHAFIRETLGKMWTADFAEGVRIQYGGSMKPENAAGLLEQPDVDGGLIGGASLKAESFVAICKAAL